MLNQITTLSKNWKVTTLGEIVSLAQGVAINAKTDYVLCDEKEGLPLLKINNLLNNTVDMYANPKLVTSKAILHKDDVIFTRTGQVGWVFTGKEGILHNNSFKVIPSKNIDGKYLYWFLKQRSIFEYVQRVASGSAQPDLNHSAFRTIEINLPTLPEQQAIAAILSSLDKKIELLRELNKTLEATAQAIFKEWFVTFNFPDSTGKMIDSELGEIPEGWIVYKLKDLLDVINGYSYKGDELQDKARNALVTLKSFDRTGGFQIRGFKPFVGNPKSNQEVLLGDLVVAHTDLTQDAEVLGNPAFIFDDDGYEKMYITMDLVKVVSKIEDITNGFFYYLMRTRSFKKHCVGYSNGTTVLHLSKKAIPEYKVVLPENLTLVKEFSKIAYVTTQKIISNFSQIQTLIYMRDSLLPKLMKGDLRVKGFRN